MLASPGDLRQMHFLTIGVHRIAMALSRASVGTPIFRPPNGQRGHELRVKIHRSGFSFVSEDVLLRVCPP
jgi:hypothetical protein